MKFYLGTHVPSWLGTVPVPLFVSHRRLKGRKTFPKAQRGWALDSGGFTELSMYGEWTITPKEYAEAVERYSAEIGRLDWAAPQDWMCEPHILEKTGLSVEEHQHRTVQNYLDLKPRGPFIPVLQGWSIDDYLQCVQLYKGAGVDLTEEPIVGVGSVCRRQNTKEIHKLFQELFDAGISCHGFGVKTAGLKNYSHLIRSADSMAWSYTARRKPPLDGCTTHKNCANCSKFALQWRESLLSRITHNMGKEEQTIAA